MKTISTAWHIRIVFALMAAILAFTWGANSAHAQESSGSSLSISPSGQIIAKGATIISVSDSILTVETSWGAAKMVWNVQVTGSTRLIPDLGSRETLSQMKKGQTVSFSGSINTNAAKPMVIASSIKNDELIRESVSILGTVESVDEDNGTFELRTLDGVTTVQVSGRTLMSKNGGYMDIGDIEIGDSSRATGTLDTRSGVLTAARITLKTGEPEEIIVEQQEEGVLASIVDWLRGSRGILSVRDR